jgi:hypothetical protein
MKPKSNKQPPLFRPAPPAAPRQKAITAKPEQVYRFPFLSFMLRRPNRTYLLTGLVAGVVYLICLRLLYPIPSCYSDSFTYLQVAQDKQLVSFRPVEYSHIINLFKSFSTSDVALIFGQYFSNVLANLLLFFTTLYFVPLRKANQVLLFALLVFNPLYIMYSNYILTDALFGAFTVTWFVLLIWIMHQPRWYYMAIQLLVLLVLFKLRYNAIVFPLILGLALYMSRQKRLYKIISLGVSILLIMGLVIQTTNNTERETGVRTFSAFSGWQLANNALHIWPYEKIDTTSEDEEIKNLSVYLSNYKDTSTFHFDSLTAHSGYMWYARSPLKTYIPVYAKANGYPAYFLAWTALGDVYSRFGKRLILQHPDSYLRHFVLPNTQAYFLPDLEAYTDYFTHTDTLPLRMQQFYHYTSNKVGPQHEWAYTIAFKPWRYLFPVLNILLLLTAATYYATKRHKKEPPVFNRWLLCFLCFFAVNLFFIVLLAPTVFRYHVFIITLSFPLVIYMLQQLVKPKQVAVRV